MPRKKPEIRSRVVELRNVRAGDLQPNPHNWRRHPEGQQSAIRAVIDDVGFVGAVMARQLEDGSLELVDGHMRAGLHPDSEIPVLVVDLDDEEARKVLATFDPLGDLAVPDTNALAALLQGVDFGEYADLRKLHADMAAAMDRLVDIMEKEPKEKMEKIVDGMDLQPHEHFDYLVVLASTTREWNTICDRLGLKPVARRGKMGTCRGIRAEVLLEALEGRDRP